MDSVAGIGAWLVEELHWNSTQGDNQAPYD
jgi:hypothetical protein